MTVILEETCSNRSNSNQTDTTDTTQVIDYTVDLSTTHPAYRISYDWLVKTFHHKSGIGSFRYGLWTAIATMIKNDSSLWHAKLILNSSPGVSPLYPNMPYVKYKNAPFTPAQAKAALERKNLLVRDEHDNLRLCPIACEELGIKDSIRVSDIDDPDNTRPSSAKKPKLTHRQNSNFAEVWRLAYKGLKVELDQQYAANRQHELKIKELEIVNHTLQNTIDQLLDRKQQEHQNS